MVIMFFLLIFWFICSGQFSVFFIIAALLSIVTTILIDRKLFTSSFFIAKLSNKIPPPLNSYKITFFIKLFYEMFISSLKVGKIIWFDYKEVKPCCVLIDAKSFNKIEQVIQANAITLTPGTMSLHLKDNKILVHAINYEMAQEIKED